MLMQKATDARMDKRSVSEAIFYFLLARLGARRLRGHSFFAMLLAKPAVVVDFGAHRGEFFAALKAEYPVSRALLVEADPALAESLKGTLRLRVYPNALREWTKIHRQFSSVKTSRDELAMITHVMESPQCRN